MTEEKRKLLHPTSEILVNVYNLLVEQKEVSFPIYDRQIFALDSIVKTINAEYFGFVRFLTNEDKAAAYFCYIIKNHPVTDGNKRLAVLWLDVFANSLELKLNNVKLLNAGHILGARQIAVEQDGAKAVYTGDICLRDNLISKGAEIEECDTLIIEATYADPFYKFPLYENVCEDIAKWINEHYEKRSANIIIGCYELGKAQELVKLLNLYCGITPLVNEKMNNFCEVYENFGIKLDRVLIGSSEAEEIMKKPFVALVPMRNGKRYFARRLAEAFNRDTLACIATGWSLRYGFNVDKAFPLSDHADHYDLKYYIEQSDAREVEFFSGDGSSLVGKKVGNPKLSIF